MRKTVTIFLIIASSSLLTYTSPNYPAITDSTEQIKNSVKNNLLFIEIAGNGLGLSINYERYISDNLSFRVGWGNDIFKSTYIPLLFNYNFELPWELGIGIVSYNFHLGYRNDKIFASKSSGILITSVIGYKKKFNWFLLKVSFTPFYNPVNSKFQLYGGLSLGIAF